jgi:hypothetical protein
LSDEAAALCLLEGVEKHLREHTPSIVADRYLAVFRRLVDQSAYAVCL